MVQQTCERCCMDWTHQMVSHSLHYPHRSLNVQRDYDADCAKLLGCFHHSNGILVGRYILWCFSAEFFLFTEKNAAEPELKNKDCRLKLILYMVNFREGPPSATDSHIFRCLPDPSTAVISSKRKR